MEEEEDGERKCLFKRLWEEAKEDEEEEEVVEEDEDLGARECRGQPWFPPEQVLVVWF